MLLKFWVFDNICQHITWLFCLESSNKGNGYKCILLSLLVMLLFCLNSSCSCSCAGKYSNIFGLCPGLCCFCWGHSPSRAAPHVRVSLHLQDKKWEGWLLTAGLFRSCASYNYSLSKTNNTFFFLQYVESHTQNSIVKEATLKA